MMAHRHADPTRGRCQFCPTTWDRGTDVSGWTMDRATRRWVTCPSCTGYKAAIALALAGDKPRYWDWFSCRCGAYDRGLRKTRDHKPDCLGREGKP